MQNSLSLRALLVLTICFILFPSPSMAMEKSNYSATNSRIATSMENMMIQLQPNKNTVVCPIGPKQILADLYQITDGDIKNEIAQFTGSTFKFDSYKEFVKTLPENTIFSEKITPNQYPYKWLRKGQKNAYFNGHFIMISDTFDLNEERVIQLKQLNAAITPSDFNNPEKSADYVNGIVNEHTNNKIPTILTPDAFAGDPTAMVLLSTLYIKNDWMRSFEEKKVKFIGIKKTDDVKGFGKETPIPYYETSGFKRWSLKRWHETTVMIPATGDTFLLVRMRDDGIVQPIDHTHIQTVLNNRIRGETIDFSMPAFTVKNTANLKDLLKKALPKLMGNTPFNVDLFSHPESVYVSTFIQKNQLDVIKDGLRGSSATAMVVSVDKGGDPDEINYKKITIDRPFSFAVIKMINTKNWLTLFTGQIFDPVAPKK